MTKDEPSNNGGGGTKRVKVITSAEANEGVTEPSSKVIIRQSPFENGHTVHDNLKALEEMRLDAEKGMFMFDGAIRLLEKQHTEISKLNSCAICHRSFSTKKMLHNTSRMLEAKRDSVQRLRNQEAATLHDSYVAAMNELEPKNPSRNPTPNGARLNFYLRTGELSEWRQQKMDCMSAMACFACSRAFTKEEFSAFLKRVDHRAAVMERELHVHPKFCPAPPQSQIKVEESLADSSFLSPGLSTPTETPSTTNSSPDHPSPLSAVHVASQSTIRMPSSVVVVRSLDAHELST